MKGLPLRALTAAGFVVVVLGSMILHPLAFILLFGLVTIGGVWEFYQLTAKTGARPQIISGIAMSILLYAGVYSGLYPTEAMLLLILCIGLTLFGELFRDTGTPIQNLSATVLGVLYVALPFSLLSTIYFVPAGCFRSVGYDLMLGYFLVLWMNDTGAYLIGSAIGKNKLFERISPNKTWEGTIGGCLTGMGVAYAYSFIPEKPFLSSGEWMGLGAVACITGGLGDLVESQLKRNAGVKDSGTLLPGHGGILDRFDAVLGSAPFVVAYLYIIRTYFW